MKILIIEDEELKAERIKHVLHEVGADIAIDVAHSYNAGLKKAARNGYSLLIVDMQLPVFEAKQIKDEEASLPYGGQELLDELARIGKLRPAVVITQYEGFGSGDNKKTVAELRGELTSRLGPMFLGLLHYSASQTTWRKELAAVITKLQSK